MPLPPDTSPDPVVIDPSMIRTRADTAMQLSADTVESLTEYDLVELPDPLRLRLALWWADFLTWADQ